MRTNQLLLVSLAFLSIGCQSGQPVRQSAADNGSFMGLWSVYSHCQNTKEFEAIKARCRRPQHIGQADGLR